MYVKGQRLNVTRWDDSLNFRSVHNIHSALKLVSFHLCANHPWKKKTSIYSVDTGKKTSTRMWRMEKASPAGLLTMREEAWLMEQPQTTPCQTFLRLFLKRKVRSALHWELQGRFTCSGWCVMRRHCSESLGVFYFKVTHTKTESKCMFILMQAYHVTVYFECTCLCPSGITECNRTEPLLLNVI